MSDQSVWKIDVKGLTHRQILEVLKQLEGTGRNEVILELRQELVDRVRLHNKSDAEIIRYLTRGIPRGLRLNEFAKDWAEVFGLSVAEFKRIANAG